eukprot:scpid99306/ scgid16897/ 
MKRHVVMWVDKMSTLAQVDLTSSSSSLLLLHWYTVLQVQCTVIAMSRVSGIVPLAMEAQCISTNASGIDLNGRKLEALPNPLLLGTTVFVETEVESLVEALQKSSKNVQ